MSDVTARIVASGVRRSCDTDRSNAARCSSTRSSSARRLASSISRSPRVPARTTGSTSASAGVARLPCTPKRAALTAAVDARPRPRPGHSAGSRRFGSRIVHHLGEPALDPPSLRSLYDGRVQVEEELQTRTDDAAAATPVSTLPAVELPESTRYWLKTRLLGPPLHTEELAHERLGNPTALAVFASDNLSSSAYATEEILRILIPAIGVAAFSLVVPVTVALLVVLGLLILSYRQTIKEYPSAGGAYIVTKDNFGKVPALVAGVSLLTDYVLTVAVSVAAGTAALASAVPALDSYT